MALITLSRASELIPNFNSGDTAVLTAIIQAASSVVEKFCNRTFTVTNYDDLYDGTGDVNLLLNNYPIVSVDRIGFNLNNVIQIRMTDQGVARASWRLDGSSDTPPKPNNLTLTSLKNGVQTQIVIGPLTSGTPTVTVNGGSPTTISPLLMNSDVAAAVNTYGGSYGWSALALGAFTSWPVADLRPPQGGNEARWFGVSYMQQHTWHLPQYLQYPERGEIISPMGFPFGPQAFRVVYSAGYPLDTDGNISLTPIAQAVAALAVAVYQSRGQNASVASEQVSGVYSYTNVADKTFHQMDLISRYGLALYKNYRIARYKVT